MAIGVLNYPLLDWRFVISDQHTVPVGFGADDTARVVMDILLFDEKTAEESIAYASPPKYVYPMQHIYRYFEKIQVPKMRIMALRAC
jgi:hypothetical protein